MRKQGRWLAVRCTHRVTTMKSPENVEWGGWLEGWDKSSEKEWRGGRQLIDK